MKGFLLTMQYNERRMLPLFLRHYGQFFEPSQIYVIDHGSDENLVPPGCNRIFIPRDQPFSEQARRNAVSYLAAALRNYYDWGIHVDADELIDLRGFDPAMLQENPVLYVAGFDVFRAEVQGQARVLGLLDSHLCKPAIFRDVPRWLMGFHGCAHPPQAQLSLPMAHMKHFDPVAATETAAERGRVYQGMNAAEKRAGIDVHWGKGDQTVQAFRARASGVLQGQPVPERFRPRDSAGLFVARQGAYYPAPRKGETLCDLSEHFPFAQMLL